MWYLSTHIVNPHVIPFLQKSSAPSRTRKAANFCMHMAKMELQHRCTQVCYFWWSMAVHMNHTNPSFKLTELGVAPSFFNKVQSIMSQKYSGDITIIPDIGYGDFLKVLSNPTDESVFEAIIRGEQATWPSKSNPASLCWFDISSTGIEISIIKNHLQIELTIDAILYRLRLKRLAELPYNPSTSTPLCSTRPALENRAASHLDIPRARTASLPKEDKRRSLEMERERRSTKRGLAMTATNKD